MAELNMANRQCCDMYIMDYVTHTPILDADFCNTTTVGFTSDVTYATKKGRNAIAFANPINDGTMGLEFQVHPFKIYSLVSDGMIETSALIARRENIEATEAGKLEIPSKHTPVSGTVVVYAHKDVGGEPIEGTFAEKTFTANSEGDIVVGTTYSVTYLEDKKDGVKKVSFNSEKAPKAYFVQMSTLDKNENEEMVPIRMTGYKAVPQRSLDLSFSSDGDAATFNITFDLMDDKDGNLLDMIEITDETE